MSDVRILGVRHHGPGSARAVAGALDSLRPDLVVIEGPPELDALVALAGSADLVPPVAALVYAVDEPRKASFYPMAAFSPEWVALRWARRQRVPVRFLDLPAANALALEDDPPKRDPLGELAEAAGFDDAERWWEDAVEHRSSLRSGHAGRHWLEVFDAVLDAMRELRFDPSEDDDDVETARREAAMRRVLRAAMSDGGDRIAVVCGAWHAPALVPDAFPKVSADAALLKGLPSLKVEATWVPWTTARLARATGYGAGVTAPGWYQHLFTVPDADVSTRWMVKVATLLREEELDASVASVIEATRLADGLAALRDRPLAGLEELNEASLAVLCGGSDVTLGLIAQRLLVGNELGRVPDDTPMVPLARDLARLQKKLRLKASASAETLELDLRTASHLERSKLFHRLLVLKVPWAVPAAVGRTKGTFREAWTLEWQPELSVLLVEASGAGTTIEAASDATVRQRACEANDLGTLAALVEQALLADLPKAVVAVVDVLGERTAHQHDVPALMGSVEPLARVRRYGDVRGADTHAVQTVLEGMLTRIAIGLPAACASLDDDAAAEMARLIESVQRSVALLDEDEIRDRWFAALRSLADQAGVHGRVAGWAVRLLLDANRLPAADAARRLSLALSRGADHWAGAAWVEGFLTGDALLLLHDAALLAVLDDWVGEVSVEVFDDVLPLLRRSFGRFSGPERRQLGEHLRRLGQGGPGARGAGDGDGDGQRLDPERADRVLPVLRLILEARP